MARRVPSRGTGSREGEQAQVRKSAICPHVLGLTPQSCRTLAGPSRPAPVSARAVMRLQVTAEEVPANALATVAPRLFHHRSQPKHTALQLGTSRS